MTKNTKTADTIPFPTFDPEKAGEQLRVFAEQGVATSREAYAKMKGNAETAQKAMEVSFEKARVAGSELSLKSIAAMRAHTDAGFSHLEALSSARSLSDIVELQTAFARKWFEMTIEQTRDFQSASVKAVEEVSQPVKQAVQKTATEQKVA